MYTGRFKRSVIFIYGGSDKTVSIILSKGR